MCNIITEKMVFGGDCIGKINGKTVFIPYSIPGETLKIKIVSSKRDYDIAEIEEIIKPSPYRVNPPCKKYGKCGGCNLMHIADDYQRVLRTEVLRDSFKREGIELGDIQSVYGKTLGYRCRFQLHNGGLEERSSNNIVDIDNCLISDSKINEYFMNTLQKDRPLGKSYIFGSDKANPNIITVQKKEKREAFVPKKGNKKYGKHYIKPRFEGITENDSFPVSVNIHGKNILFDAQGFFQSNLEVLEKTIDLITDGLSGKNALDMYSGAGTFSVFLADLFEKLTLVEHNRGALVFAEQNLMGKKHDSYGISGEKWVKENASGIIQKEGNFDALVIDPPRSGIEKEVLFWICKSDIKHIRSLSCDPVTHARDAKELLKAGYKIKKSFLLDFYPQTSHVESLIYFEKL